jgi:hypothetical protein
MRSRILPNDNQTADMNFLPVIQVSPECKQVSLTGVSIMGNGVCEEELTEADMF